MRCAYVFVCALLTTDCFLNCRLRLDDFFVKICLLPGWFIRSFPFAVTLNLAFTAFLVFIFVTTLLPLFTRSFISADAEFVTYVVLFFLPPGARTTDKFLPSNLASDSAEATSDKSSQML
jgi:hypothetical protein